MAVSIADIKSGPESAQLHELNKRIDEMRTAMEAELEFVRERSLVYLNWYSPEFNSSLGTHDAWVEPILVNDVGLTRGNFPIARAVVDIWAALEASQPPAIRAEPERVSPPPPTLDQATDLRLREVYGAYKKIEGVRATMRGDTIRRWIRKDDFNLKAWTATRRKDLYGFSWMKVWPDNNEKRPKSHVVRNPTTVYPLWSSRDPGEVEAILVAYQKSATKINAEYRLGLPVEKGRVVLGQDSGKYRDLNNRWYDTTRTMVWVEEYWWRELEYDPDDHRVTDGTVYCATRITDKVVRFQQYKGWRKLPWVYWENTDERDAYGWSDIASVIDINDEFNRRLSQEGDIIGQYSAPRFQLLNSFAGRDVEMPGPFELISLQDQEKIEQILTRIDTFPAQQHFQILFDLLHRVTGLPPIVWGLIANAQTSGRALSASWKATEARLAPKLLRNQRSYNDWLELVLDYAQLYDWKGAKELFNDRDGEAFRDFRWEFPPMEPRDFLEVTQNEITKRDAGFTSTLKGIRATGDEAAEDTLEEIMAEKLNIFLHPADVQAFLLAQRAELDNIAYASQLGVQIGAGGGASGNISPTSVNEAVGLARQTQQAAAAPAMAAPEGAAPPTQAGAVANAAQPGGQPEVSTGTLMRQGKVSNQFLQMGQMGPPPSEGV